MGGDNEGVALERKDGKVVFDMYDARLSIVKERKVSCRELLETPSKRKQ